jgi:hypothetical protein
MAAVTHRVVAMAALALWTASCGPSVAHVGEIADEPREPFDSSALCGPYDFVAELTCDVAASGDVCTFDCTDGAGHAFDAECSGGGCRCLHDGALACSCVFNEPGATCELAHQSCCPAPWP